MNYTEFLEIVKSEKLYSTYLFLGEEEYLINECIAFMKKRYVEESLETLNFIVLDGKTSTIDDLVNTCETLPFMSSKK